MTEQEIWKKVPERFGEYWVSSLGRIKSQHRLLNPQPNKKGYIAVSIKIKGRKSKTITVHRLVGYAFDFITDIDLVNHKDGNKANNRLENLERADHALNSRHAYDTGLIKPMKGEKHPMSKLTNKDIKAIITAYGKGEKGLHIAKRFNVSTSLISAIAHGKIWPEFDALRKSLKIEKRKSRPTVIGEVRSKQRVVEITLRELKLLCLNVDYVLSGHLKDMVETLSVNTAAKYKFKTWEFRNELENEFESRGSK